MVRGQASLEMTAAIVGALLLLLGAVQFTLWCAQRYVSRMRNYDGTRPQAASLDPGRWDGSYEPAEPLLNILNE